MAAHALGCTGCRPGCPLDLPDDVLARLSAAATHDPNAKVRAQAHHALANLGRT